jgi:4-hydroxy-tetrahydrodipicolinate reductase
MGKEVTRRALDEYKETTLVCGVDGFGADAPVPCYKSFTDVTEDVDCVIDFSHHSLTAPLLDFCKAKKLPVVIATTGQTEEEQAMIAEAAKEIPVFFSKNMSVGIALLCELAKNTVKAFPDADIEIVETHHNRKADAPSGTALLLADAVKEKRPDAEYVFGRSGQHKRQPNEIGIHALRMGNVVGEHEVIFATDNQTISLKHQAHDRALFADGAIAAARFIVTQAPGFYHMDDLLGP